MHFDIIDWEELKKKLRKIAKDVEEWLEELLQKVGLVPPAPPKPPLDDTTVKIRPLVADQTVAGWWKKAKLRWKEAFDALPDNNDLVLNQQIMIGKLSFLEGMGRNQLDLQTLQHHIAVSGTEADMALAEDLMLRFASCSIDLNALCTGTGNLAESVSEAWIAFHQAVGDMDGRDSDVVLRNEMIEISARLGRATR